MNEMNGKKLSSIGNMNTRTPCLQVAIIKLSPCMHVHIFKSNPLYASKPPTYDYSLILSLIEHNLEWTYYYSIQSPLSRHNHPGIIKIIAILSLQKCASLPTNLPNKNIPLARETGQHSGPTVAVRLRGESRL